MNGLIELNIRMEYMNEINERITRNGIEIWC